MRVESRCSRPPLTASFPTSLHFNFNFHAIHHATLVKLIITFLLWFKKNQLNSSLHNTNSPSSSFIATTRWQRKMDTCGKNTTVTTEENANGKTYSSANISIQCKIPARVSLNPDEKRWDSNLPKYKRWRPLLKYSYHTTPEKHSPWLGNQPCKSQIVQQPPHHHIGPARYVFSAAMYRTAIEFTSMYTPFSLAYVSHVIGSPD